MMAAAAMYHLPSSTLLTTDQYTTQHQHGQADNYSQHAFNDYYQTSVANAGMLNS